MMTNAKDSVKRVEGKQVKLAENSEAFDRWLSKLLRAANELRKLRDQRKRLLKPNPRIEEQRRERKRERDRARRAAKKIERETNRQPLDLV